MRLNVWGIGRDGTGRGFAQAFKFEINQDYLTNEKSTFSLRGELSVEVGEFLVAKETDSSRICYFGVVDSFENDVVKATDLYSLLSFEFVTVPISGKSFEEHLYKLIKRYLFEDPTKLVTCVDVDYGETQTSHIYQGGKSEPVARTLLWYAINGFKKYHVVWVFDGLELINGKYRIKTKIKRVDGVRNIKNNIYTFLNWNVYFTPVRSNSANHLVIYSKGEQSMEDAKPLSVWYLTQDNELVQDPSDKVWRPTRTRVAFYDLPSKEGEEDRRPTYQEIAADMLRGNHYSHEITFDVTQENEFLNWDDYFMGLKYNIVYDGSMYKSVLTGWRYSSEGRFIQLRFGNVRSRFSELLD
ncbi:hypothetical protein C6P08_06830 [Weissella confusa]|uniref:hypothetical protein n=1 Tax=Weissella confusa TaxID=1583 RepID=UPI0010929EC1|nr:hypothetical protein [Weissella confusa]MBJ7694277.1 hypothetical protein [Weissella confusa]QBZ04912.1 hypothetical protein C6P08_06830 [Weissella confusa]